jgi:hypothetical protein
VSHTRGIITACYSASLRTITLMRIGRGNPLKFTCEPLCSRNPYVEGSLSECTRYGERAGEACATRCSTALHQATDASCGSVKSKRGCDMAEHTTSSIITYISLIKQCIPNRHVAFAYLETRCISLSISKEDGSSGCGPERLDTFTRWHCLRRARQATHSSM